MSLLNVLTPTDFANGIPPKYIPVIIMEALRRSFWEKHEGNEFSTNKAIVRRDDLTKSPGSNIKVLIAGQLIGSGKESGEQLEGYEEKGRNGQLTVTLGVLRHATAYRMDTEEMSLYRLGRLAAEQLADWSRRELDGRMDKHLIANAPQLYANDATSVATLGSNDTLSVSDLLRIYAALSSMGARPLDMVRSSKGDERPIFGCRMSSFDWYHLQQDSNFKSQLQYSGVRGEGNPIYTGAQGIYNGLILYVQDGMRKIQGSALRPSAALKIAHTNSVTTITVGVDDKGDYLRWFPSSGTVNITSTAGVVEQVTYTGKTKYTLTGCTRGANSTTAAAYSGGEFVELQNYNSRILGFGAQAAARCFGSLPKKIGQKRDYDEEEGIGIRMSYGEQYIPDVDGNAANVVCLNAYSNPVIHTL